MFTELITVVNMRESCTAFSVAFICLFIEEIYEEIYVEICPAVCLSFASYSMYTSQLT